MVDSGIQRVKIDWNKVKEMQRKLSKIKKRRISFNEICGFGTVSLGIAQRTKMGSNLSIKNFRRIYHYFRDQGMLHDYLELLSSYEEVPDVHDEQSAAPAASSGQVRD